MWYEILPSAALVFGFMVMPPYATMALNYLTLNGKRSARYWDNNYHDWHLYLRDQRITGSEYVPRGLEGLPEEK